MNDLGKLLDVLGRDPTEHLSLNKRVNGHFESQVVTVAEITERGVDPNGERWYSTAVLNPRVNGGRGNAIDVVGIRELFCDLDVKPGGMPDWDTARQVINTLAGMLGVGTVAVVNSGHGLQPHWRLERSHGTDWPDDTDPRWGDAVALYRRWGRLVASVAEHLRGRTDSVYDLARILRVPGTVNTKAEPVPVTAEWFTASLVSIDRLLEVLDDYGIGELAGDRDMLGETVAPPAGWTFNAATTCGYVMKMVAGETIAPPPAIRGSCPRRSGSPVRTASDVSPKPITRPPRRVSPPGSLTSSPTPETVAAPNEAR
jgi:hypothetical protein